MAAFLLVLLFMGGVMLGLLRLMYPKPPQAFFAKAGEDVRLRACSYCGHSLATYRGILEDETGRVIDPTTMPDDDATKACIEAGQVFDDGRRFFCNDEHRTAFYDKLHSKGTP